MNNLFNTPLQIHERYDLKGSTWGRTAGSAARAQVGFAESHWCWCRCRCRCCAFEVCCFAGGGSIEAQASSSRKLHPSGFNPL